MLQSEETCRAYTAENCVPSGRRCDDLRGDRLKLCERPSQSWREHPVLARAILERFPDCNQTSHNSLLSISEWAFEDMAPYLDSLESAPCNRMCQKLESLWGIPVSEVRELASLYFTKQPIHPCQERPLVFCKDRDPVTTIYCETVPDTCRAYSAEDCLGDNLSLYTRDYERQYTKNFPIDEWDLYRHTAQAVQERFPECSQGELNLILTRTISNYHARRARPDTFEKEYCEESLESALLDRRYQLPFEEVMELADHVKLDYQR